MGYLEQNLIAGETVAFRGRKHWVVLVQSVAIAILLSVPGLVLLYLAASTKQNDAEWFAGGGGALLLLATIVLLRGIWRRKTIEIAVTNKRIILMDGIVKRRTEEIVLQKVESIVVNQGFWGQLLHYGTVVVRGTGGTFEPIDHVAHALEMRREVQEQVSQIR
jgi:uncharacterized membrane protein YdbT with pleckstrin-like domain